MKTEKYLKIKNQLRLDWHIVFVENLQETKKESKNSKKQELHVIFIKAN